jgi:acetylornithine deacetylase/succinyl-diaminopimelate desuccinylase-like protein
VRRPDRAALAATLAELIALPSTYPPGDCREIARHLAARLRTAGLRVEVHGRRAGVDNVVARLGTGRPRLVYSTHVDTVTPGARSAWTGDPFVARIEHGRMVGVGAANAKGALAAQLWLAEAVAGCGGPRRGELVFAFVGDEERLGPDGLCYLRENGAVEPDVLVLGGPTSNQLITAERGVLWARLSALGRSAHAGDPSQGDSAILRMVRLIGALERGLGGRLAARRDGAMQATLNIGRIAGGENTNAVPDRCTIEIDRRLLPAETVEGAFEELRDAALEAGEPAGTLALELLSGTPGFKGASDGTGVRAFQAAIEAETGGPARFLDALGVSDGRYFARDGVEIIGFGPGEGAAGHAPDEWLALDQLEAAGAILWQVTDRLLGLAAA